MALEIYNTLTRKKEVFTPLEEGRVGMYVCGPTVYSDSHIGHAKSYITFDVVRRYLMFSGYQVTYVENITDVGHLTDDADEGEDKLIKRGREIRQHPMQIAETYTRRFFEDMTRLNVLPPDIAPRATGHIPEQIEMIETLINKGFAYESGGNVYFDITKDPDYGKLSGRRSEDQEASGMIYERTDKRNPQDFALLMVPAPLATLMMRPRLRAIMPGRTALQNNIGPFKLTSIVRHHWSGSAFPGWTKWGARARTVNEQIDGAELRFRDRDHV